MSDSGEKRCSRPGRPREFEPKCVIEAASRLFWNQGYSGTSLSDLMAATGLRKGSLYSTFGDKHQLYLTCLKTYLSARLENFRACLNKRPYRQALLSAFQLLAHQREETNPLGCFALHSLTEVATHDPEVSALLNKHLSELEREVKNLFKKGQQAGEFRAELSTKLTARSFCSLALAIRARSRCQETDSVDEGLGAFLLSLLSSPNPVGEI